VSPSQDRIRFRCGSLNESDIRVVSFKGKEEISRPYAYEVTFIHPKEDVSLSGMLGQSATLRLLGAAGERRIHGVVERFEQSGAEHASDQTEYLAVIVPRIALLRHTRNSRIFQGKSIIDITKAVLKDAKLPQDALDTKLSGSYGERNYCAQYQESDLDFISRLLEEEGVFFFFKHTDKQEVLILADSNRAVESAPHAKTLSYRPHHDVATDRLDPKNEGITQFQLQAAVVSGSVTMRDFRFVQPGLSDMEVKESAEHFKQLHRYYYPGEYVDPKVGQHLVKARLQEHVWQQECSHGMASSPLLAAGYKFELKEHPRNAVNKEYLLVSVEQQDGNAFSDTPVNPEVKFTCIASSVPFRPQRQTPVPRILGLQTAIVVGPKGEEIYCDKYGRVKVQFHWDREGQSDAQSSCWIRVSQGWAGPGYGGMYLPRIGHEVVVQFLDGDPDRPLIIGRVYNGDNSVPHELDKSKTQSGFRTSSTPGGKGFNEIRFEDEASKEEFYLHAQRNYKKEILNDSDTTIGGNRTEHISGKSDLTIDKSWTIHVKEDRHANIDGNDETQIKKDRTVEVDGNESMTVKGNQDLSIDKKQTVSVKSDRRESVDGKADLSIKGNWQQSTDSNMGVQVAKNLTVTVDGDIRMQGKTITLTADNKITLEVGNSVIKISSSGIEVTSNKIKMDGTTIAMN